MRFVATLFVVSLLPLLPSSRAPDTQIGDWVFRLPEGMAVRTGLDGQPVLAFRDTPDNYSTTVRFAHSADLAGDDPKEAFRSWAREGREALRKSLDIEAEGDVSESTTAAGYHMLAWVAPYTDHRSVNWLTILTCLRRDRRASGLIFFTNDFDRLANRAATLDALLATVTFDSLRPAGQAPPKLAIRIDPTSTPSFLWGPTELPTGTAGLEGIYGASGLGAAGDPREGITTARFQWRYYAFFADGTVMRELPPEGLLAFRLDYWARRFDRACGRYEIEGDVVKMTFTLPGGGRETESLTRRGADLMDGGRAYRKLPGDGVRLAGTFLRHDWSQLSAARRQAITFDPVGRFSDEGVNSTINVGWWVGGDCVLRDLRTVPGRGTWRVARNTLELIYEDGRRRRFAFHLYTGEPSDGPRTIVLNGNVLVRRG